MARSLADLRNLIREHALSMPGATEDFPWGESVAKVKGKVFVFLGRNPEDSGELSFSVKLPQSGREALGMTFTAPTAYGLGTHGWVTVTVRGARRPPEGLLRSWVEESWRAVAPKRLAQATEAGGPTASARKPRQASSGTPRASKATATKRGAKT